MTTIHPLEVKSEEENEEQAAIEAVMLSLLLGLPMTLRSAIELGIIDTIYGDGSATWLSPSEIANRLPRKLSYPHAPALLDRVLRLLASYSVLKCRTVRTGGEVGEVCYGAGPVCKFLVENKGSGSVRAFFLLGLDRFSLEKWFRLSEVIMEGGTANTEMLYGHKSNNEMLSKAIDDSMSGLTRLIMNKALEAYDGFEGVDIVVDVGGGIGTALSFIIAKYPHIRGVNFDLPHVVADSPSYPGVEHVGGDMFVNVPKGDAIFMKNILHNWSDEQCLKILNNCCEALPRHGKVIVVESIVCDEEPKTDAYSKIISNFDVGMLVHCPGGKERTLKEYGSLAVKSGFLGCQVVCSAYNVSVMELHKSQSIEE